MFEPVEGRARVLVFTESPSRLVVPGERPCTYCQQTVELVQELASVAGKVDVEVYDRRVHPDKLQEFGIDRVPALVVTDGETRLRGVRYFGIPAGYEFGALLEDLVDVASGRTRLSEPTRRSLGTIQSPVHLKVFVTPT